MLGHLSWALLQEGHRLKAWGVLGTGTGAELLRPGEQGPCQLHFQPRTLQGAREEKGGGGLRKGRRGFLLSALGKITEEGISERGDRKGNLRNPTKYSFPYKVTQPESTSLSGECWTCLEGECGSGIPGGLVGMLRSGAPPTPSVTTTLQGSSAAARLHCDGSVMF